MPIPNASTVFGFHIHHIFPTGLFYLCYSYKAKEVEHDVAEPPAQINDDTIEARIS